MTDVREIASGLGFPEGPIAMPDGSVILVEIFTGELTRITADGKKECVAKTGGGPNGAALGPDGRIYICNNGGVDATLFQESTGKPAEGVTSPKPKPRSTAWPPIDPGGGSLQAVNVETGTCETLYTECAGWPLNACNDLVFDAAGGFYFTDFSKRSKRLSIPGAVYYAQPDGTSIHEVLAPIDRPNGVGLSPDEKTLYIAQTDAGRLWAFDVLEPGVIKRERGHMMGARLLATLPGGQQFDSLAVDSQGNVCVGSLHPGAITVVSPDGASVRQYEMPDDMATNICFGGPDLKTAYITLSETGRLVAMAWDCPGLPLNFLNT